MPEFPIHGDGQQHGVVSLGKQVLESFYCLTIWEWNCPLCLLGTRKMKLKWEEEEDDTIQIQKSYLPVPASAQPSVCLRTGHFNQRRSHRTLFQTELKSPDSVNCWHCSLYHRTKAENHAQLVSNGGEWSHTASLPSWLPHPESRAAHWKEGGGSPITSILCASHGTWSSVDLEGNVSLNLSRRLGDIVTKVTIHLLGPLSRTKGLAVSWPKGMSLRPIDRCFCFSSWVRPTGSESLSDSTQQ